MSQFVGLLKPSGSGNIGPAELGAQPFPLGGSFEIVRGLLIVHVVREN
jgi:hypothetical protein